ncbi:MAG: CDP-glycerol glycerophosphotransferase family protein [Lachnospiraceae bacterium]|nr:CDP-glycerol glycerophosphotransferase family protein [Lachnospiraceae bacterium]
MIKSVIKDLAARALKAVLSVFKLFPIKDNRVFFQSYSGTQYSCNPKYISEALEKEAENYELIWAFTKPWDHAELESRGIRVVKYESIPYWYYRLTARVTVNNVNYRNYTPARKGQYEIQTWHGGGFYKKTMADDKEVMKDRLAYERTMRDFDRYSLMMASSQINLLKTIRGALCFKGKVLKGTPKDDVLVNGVGDGINKKVRDYLGVSDDVKIALYAPTWRQDAQKSDFDVDYEAVNEALTDRFGGEWVMLRRLHHFAAKFFDEDSSAYIKAESYPEMQELLGVVDVLISDYSSSIWDFSFTGKPCFLFCSDLKKYTEDRDFYEPIETWGFPVTENNAELISAINKFDEEDYKNEIEKMHAMSKAFEEGHATRDVCDIIRSVVYGTGEIPEGIPLA